MTGPSDSSRPGIPILARAALRMVPRRWRTSVARDLMEEASLAGRRGVGRDVWIAGHIALVAVRFLCVAAAQSAREAHPMRTFPSDVRDLVLDDEGDDLDPQDRARLHAALERSAAAAREGDVRPATEILARIRTP